MLSSRTTTTRWVSGNAPSPNTRTSAYLHTQITRTPVRPTHEPVPPCPPHIHRACHRTFMCLCPLPRLPQHQSSPGVRREGSVALAGERFLGRPVTEPEFDHVHRSLPAGLQDRPRGLQLHLEWHTASRGSRGRRIGGRLRSGNDPAAERRQRFVASLASRRATGLQR